VAEAPAVMAAAAPRSQGHCSSPQEQQLEASESWQQRASAQHSAQAAGLRAASFKYGLIFELQPGVLECATRVGVRHAVGSGADEAQAALARGGGRWTTEKIPLDEVYRKCVLISKIESLSLHWQWFLQLTQTHASSPQAASAEAFLLEDSNTMAPK
jgi:hypothetical protein